MYRRILVPLDGSPLAEQVLAWVQIVAKGLGCSVELLRVAEPVPQELADPAHGAYAHQMEANLTSYAQDYLNDLAAPLQSNGLTVSTTVRVGNPADCIAGDAGEDSDTLIAMTTHGRSGIERWLLGSITGKVLHITTNPLLVVRAFDPEHPPVPVKFENLIIPLDGSPLAEQVLPHAESLAKALGLRVLLARALPSKGEYHQYLEHYQLTSSAAVYSGMYEEFSREADAQAMEYLHRIKQRLYIHLIPSVEERLVRGRAASAIVDLARQTPNSLIAMTTHGRTGVGRWLLGSVADRVVRQSREPVLLVRAAPESAG